jgi:uncharacterized protein (TIGR03083 family)
MASNFKGPRQALRSSHERLARNVSAMTSADAEHASYCKDWTVAQVLSHLGSGGEIGLLLFTAALAGEPIPGRDQFEPIWDKWNKRSASEVTDAVVGADRAYLDALESASDDTLESLRVPMMGRELDADALITMRLGEHALHLWDIEVVKDDTSAVQREAVEQLIDRTPANAGRFARGERPSFRGVLELKTTGPDRRFGLDLSGDDVKLAQDAPAGEGLVELPAESLLRLLYGRLDPSHTPDSVRVSGPVSLDELRRLFPGF